VLSKRNEAEKVAAAKAREKEVEREKGKGKVKGVVDVTPALTLRATPQAV